MAAGWFNHALIVDMQQDVKTNLTIVKLYGNLNSMQECLRIYHYCISEGKSQISFSHHHYQM